MHFFARIQESSLTLFRIATVKLPQQFGYVRYLERQIRDQKFPEVQNLTVQRNEFRRTDSGRHEETVRTIEAYEAVEKLQGAKAKLETDIARMNNQYVTAKKEKRQMDEENKELNKEKRRLMEESRKLMEEKEILTIEKKSLEEALDLVLGGKVKVRWVYLPDGEEIEDFFLD